MKVEESIYKWLTWKFGSFEAALPSDELRFELDGLLSDIAKQIELRVLLAVAGAEHGGEEKTCAGQNPRI